MHSVLLLKTRMPAHCEKGMANEENHDFSSIYIQAKVERYLILLRAYTRYWVVALPVTYPCRD